MKRSRGPDDHTMNQIEGENQQGDPCKVPKTSPRQNPSGPKEAEAALGAGKGPSGGTEHNTTPLNPVEVNEEASKRQEVPHPTAKELAAARAARIRLGLEKPDGSQLQDVEPENALHLPTGVERKVDMEYINTENLVPLEDPKKAAEELLSELASKDWVAQCHALNLTRQLAVHHKEECQPMLDKIVSAVVKLIKSPRSSVCKTSLMCCTDLFAAFKDDLLDLMDVGGASRPASSLLCQLFLRAANDKQFVIEEAQRTLAAVAVNLSVMAGLEKAIPYLKHRNPKVRGKAATLFAALVSRMNNSDVNEYGLEKLLGLAAAIVSDNTPDARQGARKVLSIIKNAFLSVQQAEVDTNGAGDDDGDDDDDGPSRTPWENFCSDKLGPSKSVLILKAVQ